MAAFTNTTSGTAYEIFYGSYPGLAGSVVIAPVPVPEPGTVLAVCGFGACAVVGVRRLRRARAGES